jgi:hypothetical protein
MKINELISLGKNIRKRKKNMVEIENQKLILKKTKNQEVTIAL